MKRFGIILLILAVSLVFAAPALAAPGGMPALHGVCGRTFGGLVSELAGSAPGAVAEHVRGAR